MIPATSSISTCLGKHKARLFIGEGNFTYVEALIKKHKATHPGLGSAITATELDLECLERNKERIDLLRKEGVTIPTIEIDATQLHKFYSRRFERIHWNCPFLGSTHEERNQLRDVVLPQFFISASKLQESGDRIHVTLAQEKDFNPALKRKIPFRYERQAKYGIVRAATDGGYRLIRKRIFDSERYPGYIHMQTGKDKEHPGDKREFVFEKVKPDELEKMQLLLQKKSRPFFNQLNILPEARLLIDPSKKKYDIKPMEDFLGRDYYYFECSTDNDTSDYDSEMQSKKQKKSTENPPV